MDRRLVKIKRLVMAGRYEFTMKADLECAADGLTREDVIESILAAPVRSGESQHKPAPQEAERADVFYRQFQFRRYPHILKRRH